MSYVVRQGLAGRGEARQGEVGHGRARRGEVGLRMDRIRVVYEETKA